LALPVFGIKGNSNFQQLKVTRKGRGRACPTYLQRRRS